MLVVVAGNKGVGTITTSKVDAALETAINAALEQTFIG